jgi:hypothetical protein
MICGIAVETQTGHLTEYNQERYRYSKLFGETEFYLRASVCINSAAYVT